MMTHRLGLGLGLGLGLAILFHLAVFPPHQARADFGDCSDDGYLDCFPDAPEAPGLNCVELFNFTFSTPAHDGDTEIGLAVSLPSFNATQL